MTKVKVIAPSLEELSHAQVESSRFFGFTNASGKVLSLLSLGTLVGGAVGVAQGLKFMGPVMGASMTFGTGMAALGASVVSALVGYWLGNFDDKKIKEHNSKTRRAFSYARSTTYKDVESKFVGALASLPEYDPAHNSLPHDALGFAVMMSDENIAKLPPHVRVDVYRTQMDIELYKYKKLTSHKTVEGSAFEAKTFARPTMEEKATEYKRVRDYIRQSIAAGTLVVTPIGMRFAESSKNAQKAQDDSDDDLYLADAAVDVLDALGRGLRHAPRGTGGGFRSGGGGDFGGGGASGSWGVAAAQNANMAGGAAQQGRAFLTGGIGGGAMDSSSASIDVGSLDFGSSSGGGGGGGGGGGFDMPDLGEDGAPLLLVIAGAAAVLAACAASGASLWKNFISSADMPTLNGVHLPLITKSLASAEKDIRQMYKPS